MEISYERGKRYFKNAFRFPLDVMQNSVVSTKLQAKVYRPRLKEGAYHKIHSIMTKTSGNCFYIIVHLYFTCHFVNAFGLAVLSNRPPSL